ERDRTAVVVATTLSTAWRLVALIVHCADFHRETGKTDDVELRDDPVQGPVLVGHGNPFWPGWDVLPDPQEPYHIGPDTFDEGELVEAKEEECFRLREAGFRVA